MNRASAAAVLISLAVTGGLVQSCGKSATAPTPSDRPYFGGLEMHGNTHLSAVGDRSQLRAVALYSDGRSADVTSVVAWTVPSGSVVSVSSEGLVEALALGITSVQAVYGLTGRARPPSQFRSRRRERLPWEVRFATRPLLVVSPPSRPWNQCPCGQR